MKILKLILVIVLLQSVQKSTAQKSSVIDSLWQNYRSANNDSIKLTAANYLAFHYIFRTPSRSDSILKAERLYAKKNKLFFNLTELTNTKGIYHDVLGQKDSSKIYFKKALDLSRQYKFKTIEERCINNLGMFNWNNGEFNKAIKYFYEALEFSLDNNPDNESGRSIYLNNIGLIYQELSQYEKAIEYHNKSLKIRQKYDMIKDIARSYNNLAVCHRNLGNLTMAEKSIKLAISFAEKSNQPKQYHKFHDNLGSILNDQGKYNEAVDAYEVALNVPDEFKNQNFRSDFIIYSNLIDVYNEMGQYEKAKSAFKEGQRLVDLDSTFFMISESFYINSAKTHYASGDYDKANQLFQKYLEVKDSLFSKDNANALADIEARLKTKEKEAELAETKSQLLERELEVRQKNLLIYGSLAVILVILIISYLIIKSKQLKNKQIKKEAELQTALAKIELKNQLEEQRLRISRDLHDNIGSQLTFVISSLQYIQFQKTLKFDDIKSRLDKLGQFTQQTIHELRDTIWAMNKEEISLSEMIDRLKTYISRIDLKGHISINIPNEEILKSKFANFNAVEGIQMFRIIQESINNAMKHANANEIKVLIFRENGDLKFEISDDGRGFDAANTPKGNGIKNIQKRAEQLGAEVELYSEKNKGTTVSLKLPIKTKNHEKL